MEVYHKVQVNAVDGTFHQESIAGHQYNFAYQNGRCDVEVK